MKKYTRALILLPAIAAPVLCNADPLNGGLGNAFEILFAIVIAGAIIVGIGLVMSIRSFKRASKPGTGAWVAVIGSKLVALLYGYIFGSFTGAYGLFDIIADASLILLLLAYERHVASRRFIICYVLHAILSTRIIYNVFMFAGTMAAFDNVVMSIIMRLLIILLPVTWYVYKLLQRSEVKQVDLHGWMRSMLLGFLIYFAVYFAISFPTYEMRSSPVSFFERLGLLRFMFLGTFPHNIIMLTCFLLPGIVAYQLHRTRSNA